MDTSLTPSPLRMSFVLRSGPKEGDKKSVERSTVPF